MAARLLGRMNWALSQDKEGHRDYTIDWLVEAGHLDDGPDAVLHVAGLPSIGSQWAFGNDLDPWAFCWPNAKVKPVLKRERGLYWVVSQTFTTRPMPRRQDQQKEDPTAEPDKISGKFVKYLKEITKDRHGNILENSSHELLKGPLLEFDHNRPAVSITKHLAVLPLSTFAPMIDTVNSGAIWGVGDRQVKLSNAAWQRHYYQQSAVYYTVTYDFDVDFETFDRNAIDKGRKVLSKGGNINNPDDFEVYKDVNGENTEVLLDGNGNALKDAAVPVEIDIEHYDESNFFLLGVPATL